MFKFEVGVEAGQALLSIAAAIAVAAGAWGSGSGAHARVNNWPVFAAGNGSLPTGVDPAKLTTFTRPDGLTQSALDGHALSYLAHDAAPGDVNGRGGLQGAFDVFNPSIF